MIRITDKHACCGCSACVQSCPRQCLTMAEDAEGFLYPTPSERAANCNECGLCEQACPLLHRAEAREPLQVLAVKNANEQERMASSSGGVFIALARQTLEAGGIVFGAVFNEQWEVVIAPAERMEDVRPMMGSKYVQARVGNAFQQARQALREGRQVLFSGSPCQIAALRRFLRKPYPNLLCVDFLCHGVPSPAVWRRYVQEIQQQHAPIHSIRMRDKSTGWIRASFSVIFHNKKGKEMHSLACTYYEDPYIKGFLSDIYLRPSCYGCASKGGRSGSDLTIADYWGIGRVMPDFDDDRGVGLVLLNTPAGEAAFAALPMVVRPSKIADARTYNGGFNEHLREPEGRRKFFAHFLRGDTSVAVCVERAFHIPRHVRMWRKLKWGLRDLLKRHLSPRTIAWLKRHLR